MTIAPGRAPVDRYHRVGPLGRTGVRVLAPVAGVVVVAVASLALGSVGAFPENWNLGLAEPINEARRWLITNQTSHWLFTIILDPVTDAVDGAIDLLTAILGWLPWYGFVAFAALGLWWTRGRRAGVLGGLGVVYFGVVEVWEDGLDTLALMAVAVLVAMAIGIPVGILTARSDRARSVVRPVLDGMQTMPGFVYLVPFVLLFGIGLAPALVATLIFSLPSVVRATDLGIRAVSGSLVETAEMFGADERQVLTKLRLPLARPAILVGVNQTINLALSMVVIAALIGAGGLGEIILTSLRNLAVGRAAEAGLAIVLMAILLDRFFAGLAEPASRHDQAVVARLAGLMVPVTVVGGLLGSGAFPEFLHWHFEGAIDDLVGWAQVNLFDIGGSGIGTGPFSDFVTIRFVTPLRELLSRHIPWPVMLVGVAVLGRWLGGRRLAVGLFLALGAIGILGMWELSMDTLAQSLVAVALTLLFGVPLGILTARSDRAHAISRPFLDFLQTIPSFVLLVPVIMLFNVGRVPGVIASVLYALPVAVHYTDLGLRGVPETTKEAATSFGTTTWQRLRRVELPLAGPQLMVAVNQAIMLVLAMVVIAGLVGGGGLGLETVRALRRTDSVGTGFEAGIAIVLLAGVLDRLTVGLANRLRPPASA